MPKTIIPTIATPTSKLDANKFNRALYSPTPRVAHCKSLDVINGHIDHKNLNEPEEEYPDYRVSEAQVPQTAIRRGALSRGRTSKDLGPSHYNHELWRGMSITEKFIAIPGCGVSIFVPNKGTAMLTWQVSIGHDGRMIPKSTSGTTFEITDEDYWTNHPRNDDGTLRQGSTERVVLTLLEREGVTEAAEVPGHRFELPPGGGWYSSYQADSTLGRTWSGHKLLTFRSEAQFGWHHYAIGISSQAPNAMIRVRNMKYVWLGG